MTRKKYEVFVSYSRHDEGIVKPLAGLLGTVANDPEAVFLDVERIRPGDRWKEEIEKAIQESSLFILGWCCQTRASEFVSYEIETALQDYNRRIVPVLLCDTPLPSTVSGRQWVDMRDAMKHACPTPHRPPGPPPPPGGPELPPAGVKGPETPGSPDSQPPSPTTGPGKSSSSPATKPADPRYKLELDEEDIEYWAKEEPLYGETLRYFKRLGARLRTGALPAYSGMARFLYKTGSKDEASERLERMRQTIEQMRQSAVTLGSPESLRGMQEMLRVLEEERKKTEAAIQSKEPAPRERYRER